MLSFPSSEALPGPRRREVHPAVVLGFLIWLAPIFANVGSGTIPVSSTEELLQVLSQIEATADEDPERALFYGHETLKRLDSLSQPALRLRLLKKLCLIAYERDRHEIAAEHCTEGEALARELDRPDVLARILHLKGNAVRRLGRHHEALDASSESRDLYLRLQDWKGYAAACNGVGYAYWRMGRYPEALDAYLKAYDAFEKVDYAKGMGWALRNIGTLHLDVGEPEEARRIYLQALEIQEKVGSRSETSAVLSSLGNVQRQLGDPHTALETQLRALKMEEEADDRTGMAIVLGFIGDIYRDLGDTDLALDYYAQSLARRRETGDRRRESIQLLTIAELLQRLERHEEALPNAVEALDIAQATDSRAEVSWAHQVSATSLAALGREPEAEAAREAARRIDDEIFNPETQSALVETRLRFQSRLQSWQLKNLEEQLEDESRNVRRLWLALLLFPLLGLVLGIGIGQWMERRKTSAAALPADDSLTAPPPSLPEADGIPAGEGRASGPSQPTEPEDAGSPEVESIAVDLVPVPGSTEEVVDGPREVEVPEVPESLVFSPGFHVGASPAVRHLYVTMGALLDGASSVLIEGETGVGKERIARILHESSARRGQPFVVVNCAAIPADLLEAELFGIGRGVATGVSARSGHFRAAAGGTLLLDEIGEMPLPLQAKLLRVVQEKKVQPLGGREEAVDTWILAATNRNLARQVDEGSFRQDLYYRLAVDVLAVPSLRDRRRDVVPLFLHFLAAKRSPEAPPISVEPKAAACLARHPWPGNIRQLENLACRVARSVGDGDEILVGHLGDLSATPVRRDEGRADSPESWRLRDHVQEVERRLILAALEEVGGSRRQVASLLKISRSTLARKITELGLDDS